MKQRWTFQAVVLTSLIAGSPAVQAGSIIDTGALEAVRSQARLGVQPAHYWGYYGSYWGYPHHHYGGYYRPYHYGGYYRPHYYGRYYRPNYYGGYYRPYYYDGYYGGYYRPRYYPYW